MAHLIDNPTSVQALIHAQKRRQTYPWATSGFLRICCPKRSVLKIGLCTPDDDESPELVDDLLGPAFADGWCARIKRSVVARGMAGVGQKEKKSSCGVFALLRISARVE